MTGKQVSLRQTGGLCAGDRRRGCQSTLQAKRSRGPRARALGQAPGLRGGSGLCPPGSLREGGGHRRSHAASSCGSAGKRVQELGPEAGPRRARVHTGAPPPARPGTSPPTRRPPLPPPAASPCAGPSTSGFARGRKRLRARTAPPLGPRHKSRLRRVTPTAARQLWGPASSREFACAPRLLSPPPPSSRTPLARCPPSLSCGRMTSGSRAPSTLEGAVPRPPGPAGSCRDRSRVRRAARGPRAFRPPPTPTPPKLPSPGGVWPRNWRDCKAGTSVDGRKDGGGNLVNGQGGWWAGVAGCGRGGLGGCMCPGRCTWPRPPVAGLAPHRAQALSRGFWACGEFGIRRGHRFRERRSTRTSGPQVSSLPSTGREQSEVASGIPSVSSRGTRGGGAVPTCRAIQSSLGTPLGLVWQQV